MLQPELEPRGGKKDHICEPLLTTNAILGFWCVGGYERCAEVPDPPGRQVDGPAARRPHLLQSARPARLRGKSRHTRRWGQNGAYPWDDCF